MLKTEEEDDASSSQGNSHAKPLKRRTIKIDEEFEVLYTILLYLYTSRITFDTHPELADNLYPDEPYALKTETIYLAGKTYLLGAISVLAKNFLKRICTLENITERVFSDFAKSNPEIDEVYSA